MFRVAFFLFLASFGPRKLGTAFVFPSVRSTSDSKTILYVGGSGEECGSEATAIGSRRDFVGAFVGMVTAGALTFLGDDVSPAAAAEQGQAATVWMSGKPPKVPGQKTKDKNDVSGTRKDPNFLRSISSCKSQCENSVGPDGFARSKEECLSDCQDICCTTYEQCSFAIVPRI